MPAFKLTLSRYQIINTCLQSRIKKYWSIEELLAKLEEHDISISKRTLEKDFETMRFDERLGYFAPIKYCPINRGYYYENSDYSINAINLSREEIQTLLLAISFLKSLLGSRFANEFFEVIQKIVDKIDRSMLPDKNLDLITCDPIVDQRMAALAATIITAIQAKQRLILRLKNLIAAGTDVMVFDPCLLHLFGKEWYVIGQVEQAGVFIHMHLGLIKDVAEEC